MDNKPICKIDGVGTKKWYVNGVLHREDGPAIEYFNGNKEWYKNGKLHREDGPAIISSHGYKEWFNNGKIHRLDGPALVNDDGDNAWFINDIEVTYEITEWAIENDIDLDNLTEVDKALIKITWADYEEKT